MNDTRAAPDESRLTFGRAAMMVKPGNDPSAPRYSPSPARVNGACEPRAGRSYASAWWTAQYASRAALPPRSGGYLVDATMACAWFAA